MSTEGVEESRSVEDYSSELQALLLRVEQNCQTLLGVSSLERQAVTAGQVEEMERLAHEKARLVAEAESLERERRQLSGALARALGMPEDSSLAALASSVGEPHSSSILETRQRVVHLVHQLRTSNDGNLRLMRKSLDLMRDSMHQLRKRLEREQPYTNHGRPAPAPAAADSSLMVDCRA